MWHVPLLDRSKSSRVQSANGFVDLLASFKKHHNRVRWRWMGREEYSYIHVSAVLSDSLLGRRVGVLFNIPLAPGCELIGSPVDASSVVFLLLTFIVADGYLFK
jgi:hypothetical protein